MPKKLDKNNIYWVENVRTCSDVQSFADCKTVIYLKTPILVFFHAINGIAKNGF